MFWAWWTETQWFSACLIRESRLWCFHIINHWLSHSSSRGKKLGSCHVELHNFSYWNPVTHSETHYCATELPKGTDPKSLPMQASANLEWTEAVTRQLCHQLSSPWLIRNNLSRSSDGFARLGRQTGEWLHLCISNSKTPRSCKFSLHSYHL